MSQLSTEARCDNEAIRHVKLGGSAQPLTGPHRRDDAKALVHSQATFVHGGG
jgi:hypothetical protein